MALCKHVKDPEHFLFCSGVSQNFMTLWVCNHGAPDQNNSVVLLELSWSWRPVSCCCHVTSWGRTFTPQLVVFVTPPRCPRTMHPPTVVSICSTLRTAVSLQQRHDLQYRQSQSSFLILVQQQFVVQTLSAIRNVFHFYLYLFISLYCYKQK